METQPETIDDAAPFDPMTEMVIRNHQREAAKRPASEMTPLSQALTVTPISRTTSGAAPGAVVIRRGPMDRTATFQTTSAEAGPPACEYCKGAGYYTEAVSFGHPHFGKLFPCVCKMAEREERRRQDVDRHLARLADGMGFLAHKRLTDFDLERPLDPTVEWCGVAADLGQQQESLVRALVGAEQYLKRPDGGLFLCGPTGGGKSLLAAAIVNELVSRGVKAAYESAPKLLRFIKAGFVDHSADERLDALLDVELLLIDDLGTECRGGWNEQTLFEILDTRYKQSRRTIVTANMRRKDLSGRLASRIADMISAEIWLVVSDLREIRLRLRARSAAAVVPPAR